MGKYKKLYLEAQNHIATQNQLIGELTGYKAQLEEYSRMMQALQVENQRFLDENSKLMEQLSTAKAAIDEKFVRVHKLEATVDAKNKEIADLVEAMDGLQKASDAYIEGLKESARLTGECEGCRYDGVNVQKCGTCTRNPRAIDKYTLSDGVEEKVPAKKRPVEEATDTAELLECEAEVDDVPEATPVEKIVPPKAKDEDLKPAPKEKRQHKKFKGKGKKR